MKAITIKYLKTTSFLYKNGKLLKKYLKYENSVKYCNNLIVIVSNNLGAIHYHWIIKKESSRKTSTFALLTTPKPLTV